MNWLNKMYEDLERNLYKYKRPTNWETRLEILLNKPRKPIRNQTEGKGGQQYEE